MHYKKGFDRVLIVAGLQKQADYGWGQAAKDAIADPVSVQAMQTASTGNSDFSRDWKSTAMNAALPTLGLLGGGIAGYKAAPRLFKAMGREKMFDEVPQMVGGVGGGILGGLVGATGANKYTQDSYAENHPILRTLGLTPGDRDLKDILF